MSPLDQVTSMNIMFLNIFHIITIFPHLTFCTNITNFPAVTRFDGIEQYYQNLRSQRLGSPPQDSELTFLRSFIKKGTCKSIFNSYYFELRRETYVNVDLKDVRDELKSNYRDIFESIFKEFKFALFAIDEYHHNPYTLRRVSVDGVDGDEYTIICLVRHNHSGRIKQYFVSQQYNVNLVADASPIFGRFIFSRNPSGVTRLVALAEESARRPDIFRNIALVEMSYASERLNSNDFPTETPRADPVCRLTNSNKLRLCASLFGDPVFRIKRLLQFTPTEDNVEVTCVKREILFVSSEQRHGLIGYIVRNQLLRRRFEEWMIGCKGSTREGRPEIYYVSRGSRKNEVFVFVPLSSDPQERVSLCSIFVNVSVADELPKNNVRRFLSNDVED